MSDLSESVANLMLLYGHTWTIDGEQLVPNSEDVEEALDTLVETLYSSDEYTQIETGNLVLKRDGDSVDVYIRVGDANDRNDST